MKFKNLTDVSIEQIVACLVKAFEGYFVKMPSEPEFWSKRFEYARVEKSLSWGVFDQGELVGFVINAVDYHDQVLTAFNTGTGVLPAYRGKQLVDKMYREGLIHLRERGIEKCSLEVIDKNERAIRVYQRIGFRTKHKLRGYQGEIWSTGTSRIQLGTLEDLMHEAADRNYSWDNRMETIRRAGASYQVYEVYKGSGKTAMGYFIINPDNGYVAQLEALDGDWEGVFDGISQIQTQVRINNVKEDRAQLISYLTKMNVENTFNQFEMEMEMGLKD